MIGKSLFFLPAAAATFLGLSAGAVGAAETTTKNVDIVVTSGGPGGSSCPCNAGGTPNICLDNPSPAAGSTVNATLVCGPANGDQIGWYNTNMGANSHLFTSHIGGASTITLPLQVPNVASDRPEYWTTYLANSDGSYGTLNGQAITIPATISQVLGTALPSDVGADPFVPAHTVSVCPAGCNYAHVADAMAVVQSQSPAWDNVEITIDAGDYPYTQGSGNSIYVNAWNAPNTPAHLWFKGIIGRSGTDGTVFPRFFVVSNPTTAALLGTTGLVSVWVDNIEFGPSNYWTAIPNARQTTLRNVYIHDGAQGVINSDGPHHDLYVYNSHFARNGGGSGPEHNLYFGHGDDTDVLVIKNSIFEQPLIGHDIKTRASQTTLNCDKLLINQDWSFEGSELVDASEGRIVRIYDSLLVNGGAGAPNGASSWSDDQSFDHIRFGADRESPLLTNNYIDLQGSTLISDGGYFHDFLNLYKRMTTSPPYTAGNVRPNTFVFASATQQSHPGTGSYSPNVQDPDYNHSTIVAGQTPYGSLATDINLGTVGTNYFVYSDRAAAGLPALGTYPKGYTDSTIPAMPAACTDWVGRVKVPAS
jgi:hypothetical protein